MDLTVKKEIISAVVAYMDQHSISQSDLATKAGVRKEYLSIMLKPESNFMYSAGKGAEGFINPRHFNALARFIGFSTEKEYWTTQPTAQTSAILANLSEAKENHQTLTIIGQTGSGKSYTANLFAQRNPLDVFLITVGASDSLADLIEKIAEKLKLNVGKSKSTRLRWIGFKMRELKFDGYKPMIIFDEAEFMRQPAICAMKELHDYMHEFCSMVFVGTDQFVQNVEKLKKRNRPGIPQFHRRIKLGLRVLPSIDRSFGIFVDDIEDTELKKFILRNCDNYGELHDMLVPATREADRLNVPLSMELVRKVLNLPSGDMLW